MENANIFEGGVFVIRTKIILPLHISYVTSLSERICLFAFISVFFVLCNSKNREAVYLTYQSESVWCARYTCSYADRIIEERDSRVALSDGGESRRIYIYNIYLYIYIMYICICVVCGIGASVPTAFAYHPVCLPVPPATGDRECSRSRVRDYCEDAV